MIVHGVRGTEPGLARSEADLVAHGAAVTTVEPPAHGDYITLAQVSLRAYVDTVEAAIAAAPKPGFGRVVVTEVADERAATSIA